MGRLRRDLRLRQAGASGRVGAGGYPAKAMALSILRRERAVAELLVGPTLTAMNSSEKVTFKRGDLVQIGEGARTSNGFQLPVGALALVVSSTKIYEVVWDVQINTAEHVGVWTSSSHLREVQLGASGSRLREMTDEVEAERLRKALGTSTEATSTDKLTSSDIPRAELVQLIRQAQAERDQLAAECLKLDTALAKAHLRRSHAFTPRTAATDHQRLQAFVVRYGNLPEEFVGRLSSGETEMLAFTIVRKIAAN